MNLRIALILGLTFFTLGLITLPHYGINWDTINHLPRGQAYLRYFLTGKKDYSGLPKFFEDWTIKEQWYWQNPESLFIDANLPWDKVPKRSIYQITDANFDFYVNHVPGGHPPVSDILSSVFNRVLFGHLRLINDIDSYRVYGVFLAACLVGLIYYWISKTYGSIAGFFSTISLVLYPLFWAESHFNTEKDIPETVFWSFLLYTVWRGITQRSNKWIILSGVFFGLALGTKFNVLFVAPIIILWLLILLFLKHFKFNQFPKIIFSGLAAVLIGITILVLSWPYLWPNPLDRIQTVLSFYREVGLVGVGIQTYPLLWVIYTTPLSILFLSLVGLVFSKKNQHYFLFLLWLALPLIRVMWPGASFYGGVRQIMEYIPALAIFSGLGAQVIYARLKSNILALILLVALFIPITLKLIQIHPNENVYFNPLIGGLSGVKQANLPYWGFSFGAPYRQGVIWLNKHAEKDSKIAYAYELIPNFPRLWLRPDLILSNSNRSGYLRLGEYAITLMYQGIENRSYYEMYLRKFIKPVYEVKVDDVSILTIWKNDEVHLKTPLPESLVPNTQVEKIPTGLKFDLGQVYSLSRLELSYADSRNCSALTSGYVEISSDEKLWQRLPEVLPEEWRIAVLGEQPMNGHFIEPFVGQQARYIFLSLSPEDTCLKNILNFKLYVFK